MPHERERQEEGRSRLPGPSKGTSWMFDRDRPSKERRHSARGARSIFSGFPGAGGHFVRLNGRVYEAIHARLEHRQPLDLYHTALEVTVPEGRFVIENCWPVSDASGATRGVTVQEPVGSRLLGRYRPFRYEIRCWRSHR